MNRSCSLTPNRTILELKSTTKNEVQALQGSQSHHTGIEILSTLFLLCQLLLTPNRTILELKYVPITIVPAGILSPNRTILELKYQKVLDFIDAANSQSHHTGIEIADGISMYFVAFVSQSHQT